LLTNVEKHGHSIQNKSLELFQYSGTFIPPNGIKWNTLSQWDKKIRIKIE